MKIINLFDENRLLRIAINHYEKKEFEKAKSLFKRILNNNHEHFESNFYLAAIYEIENSYERAIELFEKLVNIKHWDKELKDFLLELYIKNSDYKKAIKLVRILINLYPDNQIYWLKLSDILYLSKRYKLSLKILEKIYFLNGDKEILNFKLMLCYRDLKRWQDALDKGEQLLTQTPKNPVYHYFVGTIYERMGDTEQMYRAYYQAYTYLRNSHYRDETFYKEIHKKLSSLNIKRLKVT